MQYSTLAILTIAASAAQALSTTTVESQTIVTITSCGTEEGTKCPAPPSPPTTTPCENPAAPGTPTPEAPCEGADCTPAAPAQPETPAPEAPAAPETTAPEAPCEGTDCTPATPTTLTPAVPPVESASSNGTQPSEIPTFEGAASRQFATGSVALVVAALLAL